MLRTAPLVGLCALGCSLLAGCGGGDGVRWVGSGKIAFERTTRDHPDNVEIWVMEADGSRQRRLTHSGGRDGRPAWSPDGRRIAFESDRDGNLEIYVMDSDGSGQRRLTHNSLPDTDPRWSPDGSMIAWSGQGASVMDADGSHRRLLAGAAPPSGSGSGFGSPTWAPDGRQLAFLRGIDDTGAPIPAQVWLVNVDGSGLRRFPGYPLEDDGRVESVPAWSPDGQQVAFVAADRWPGQVWVASLGAGTRSQLTHGWAGEGSPAWSPDGRRIAFVRSPGLTPTDSSLLVIGTESGQERYVGHQTPNGGFSWSPGGRWIACVDGVFDETRIFAVDVDHTRATELTTGHQDSHPAWWGPR